MIGFPLDEDGCIVNIGSKEKIQPEFRLLLDDIVTWCQKYLPKSIVAVYVRGSISAGRAFRYSSDADIIVVANEPLSTDQLKWRSGVIEGLLSKYDVVSDIDLAVVSETELLVQTKYPQLLVNMATQSALLFGKNLEARFPKMRPDKELANYIYPNLESDFDRLRRIFTDEEVVRSYEDRDRPISFWCIWTMRDVLRSAQALTMVVTGAYERDLKDCVENTSIIYPQLARYMEQAYRLALNPTDDSATILQFLGQYLPKFFALWNEVVLRR